MSSSLGKRKAREPEEAEATVDHGSTLFVSNLPYNATSVDLQTLFSDLAPVRSAFVVLEQGTGVSKGVGYVSFAIKEDVQPAFDSIAKDGITLNGRKLRVQWADSKPKDKDKGKSDHPVKKERKPRPASAVSHLPKNHDPLAIRTIIVSGLPASIDSKVLWKKLRKYEGAETVEWPAKTDAGENPGMAHVLFSSSNLAQEAVNKLHAHVFKGSLLSVTLKKRLESLAKVPAKKAAAGPAPSRASRLIVRNLPFDITEQDLRAVFLPHGPIHSIHIPTSAPDAPKDEGDPDGGESSKPRAKGFAFVWMLSKKDAENALEKCNGMKVKAGMAEDMVSDKQKKKKQRREEKKRAQTVNVEDGEGITATENKEEAEGGKERVIAVDWALSKEKWQEEKAKLEEAQEGEDVEDVEMADVKSEEDISQGDDDSESESEDEDEDGDEVQLGVHEGDADDLEDSSDDEDHGHEDVENEPPAKPQLPPPETGTTLFIRNIPFAATEDELRALFRSFGPLRYARITIDPETERSRGTGFACFWNKEDADKAVEQSEILRLENTGADTQPKKNPFTLPSILTPDPSSILAKSLVLHGRTLDVVRAVTRDQAGKLKEEGEKRREKADKRNLYLLREGVILPNTPAAETIPQVELEKRTNSFNARRAMLRTNPSLYVSKTRLSVRQIPIFVTERVLKRLAIHAVRAFEAEVKKDERAGLTAEELMEPVAEDVDELPGGIKEEEDSKGKKRSKKIDRPTSVKQAKIVRQQDRVEPITGKGRSRGYGFVEMHKHADALRVLRWANNNPEVGALAVKWWKEELADLIKQEKAKETSDGARLKRMKDELENPSTKGTKGTMIVEFSIENVQVVQRRAANQERSTTSDPKRPKGASKPNKDAPHPREPSHKKRRLSSSDTKSRPPKEESDPGQHIGSVIGRKRKQRKAGKKGGA
ncbi:RNA-binding domain-containing protein [Leucogyrophana mollusca]|uniref:RNA-binding domain-containing protein n=1 Tax=Leucogyrophana mollusca TaxID=85980 RepID=A0ACB8BNZ9_9AGAM|nr:RNA-binding domain-containing protein [Leucogyrophana mollusca]